MNLREDLVIVSMDRRRGHRFQPPKADLVRIPQLGDGDETDPTVYLHFFHHSWDWYVTELDQATGDAFGLVKGFEHELGYFDLRELAKTAGGPFRMPIERDCYWTPKPLSQV